MRHVCALIIGILATTTPPLQAAGEDCTSQVGVSPLIGDRAMVRTLPGVDLASFLSTINADHPGIVFSHLESIPGRDTHLLAIDAPPGTDLQLLCLDLETNYLLDLAWGECLYENEAPEGHTGSVFVDAVPEDTLFGNQYAGGLLGLDVAHGRATGAGIVVAVLDTGIDAQHPALQGRIVDGGVNLVDGNDDVSDGANGLDDDGDGQFDEMAGHGTFVSGLVIYTAPDAWILPVRVLNDDGVGDSWILTKGIYFAVDRGVEVINLSLGSTYNAAGVEDAIDEASSRGIPVVAAAGNLNRDCPEEYPAMTSSAVGVAATDDGDVKADFSNFNDKLAISAPGATVFLDGDPQQPDPLRSIAGTVPGGLYAVWQGSSMAAPFVSGALAIVRSQHPQWLPVETTQIAQESVLATSAADISALNPGLEDLLGAGRLDVAAMADAGPVAPALGDLDGNGEIGIDDLVRVILDWGLVHTSSDLNGDGVVGVDDVVVVILGWGS